MLVEDPRAEKQRYQTQSILVENPRVKTKKIKHNKITTYKYRKSFIYFVIFMLGVICFGLIKNQIKQPFWAVCVEMIVFLGASRLISVKFLENIQKQKDDKKDDLNTFNFSTEYAFWQIMCGQKTAFSSGSIFYELNRESYPETGNVITLDYLDGRPMVEITTISVSEDKLSHITDDFIFDESQLLRDDWLREKKKEFNQQLAVYYEFKQSALTYLWGNAKLQVESERNNLPITDKKLGIEQGKVTDEFMVICEKFMVTKIYPHTYRQWLGTATDLLLQASFTKESAQLDARMILEYVIQKNSAHILAFPETILDDEQIQKATGLLIQRVQGKPIAYLLGNKGFWTLDLAVSDKTLIPRPDTECLVETALSLIANQFASNETLRILDLGTGTGAIALALAYELQQQQKNYQIIGVDRIAESVTLAKQNAIRNQLTQVEFLESNWFSALSTQQFQIIVSNPPYIAADDPHLQQGDVRFEPRSALVAENNGLADIEHIIDQGRRFIRKQGWLLLEHGWQQAEAVQTLFKRHNWQQIQTINDYGGNPRVTFAKWSG